MGKTDNHSIVLRVKEALPKDVGRAIIRIDPEDMKGLELEVGGIVEIEGKRKTPAKVMPCYAEDRNKDIVQMDGISRENAQTPLRDKELSEALNKTMNINIACRTVAKYRESLDIPPSNQRKYLN